ncbi:hypothetical protein ABZR18_31435, partial [Pseudomonas aeruginosa]
KQCALPSVLSLDKALHWRPPLILNPSNHSKDDANVFTRSGPSGDQASTGEDEISCTRLDIRGDERRIVAVREEDYSCPFDERGSVFDEARSRSDSGLSAVS